RTDYLGADAPVHLSRQRVWHIRAQQVIVAAGAHERPIAFADNDRPGIMLASAARTYVNRYAVAPGRQAVLFTNNEDAYRAAFDLADAGIGVAAIVDLRAEAGGDLATEARRRGIEIFEDS